MENKHLEERLREIIKDIKDGKINKEVVAFQDTKSKYTTLSPSVEVTFHMTNGVSATVDITEWFTKEVK